MKKGYKKFGDYNKGEKKFSIHSLSNISEIFHKSSRKSKFIVGGIGLILLFSIGYSAGKSSQASTIENYARDNTQKEQMIQQLTSEKTDLISDSEALNAEYDKINAEYTTYKEKMSPYEGLEVADAKAKQSALEKKEAEEKAKTEAKKKEAEEKAKAEAKKKEEEEKARAEAEAKQQEEEEARGYETGITYDQLARTPDDYIYEKVKFSGKVIQVLEDEGSVNIRFAVNDNYDHILLADYDSSIVSSRILEDDMITIYGTSDGLYTYESTMGQDITIPYISIDKIDQ